MSFARTPYTNYGAYIVLVYVSIPFIKSLYKMQVFVVTVSLVDYFGDACLFLDLCINIIYPIF